MVEVLVVAEVAVVVLVVELVELVESVFEVVVELSVEAGFVVLLDEEDELDCTGFAG